MPDRRTRPDRRGPGGLGWKLTWTVVLCAAAAIAVFVFPLEPVVTTRPVPPATRPASSTPKAPTKSGPGMAPPVAVEPRASASKEAREAEAQAPPPVGVPPPSLAAAVPPPLLIPVEGVPASALRDTFNEGREGNQRGHEAIDIAAPAGTPVLAADDGRIAKLFLSKPGGITIYEFNAGATLAYYYAHLDRYAPGLAEGQAVRRGQVIGYVGTTGNAPPGAPHLHFAVFRLGPEKKWWQGEPVNPFAYLGGQAR